jgi:hypothetical protein
MVQTCRGANLPRGDAAKTYLLRSNGNVDHQIYDVTNPRAPVFVTTVIAGGHATHKNWWDCNSGIAYINYDGRQLGWKTSRQTWVVDLGDPAHPKVIRVFGLPGQEPKSSAAVVPAGAHEATLSAERVAALYRLRDQSQRRGSDRGRGEAAELSPELPGLTDGGRTAGPASRPV